MTSTKSHWSYSTGEKGRNKVRAFEHASGVLMLEFYEQGKRKRLSLGHRDQERAKQQADEAAAKLGTHQKLAPEKLTLQTLFEIYGREVTPGKSPGVQTMDRQTAMLFLNLFGVMRSASSLSQRDVTAFTRAREAGRLKPGRKVGPRTIEKNLRWLLAVLNWATLAGDGQGNYLLARNPLKGLPLPKEQNPNRPIIAEKHYMAMLGIADQVDWRFRAALVIAHETGHRIGAIRRLRWSDVDLVQSMIRWQASNDKIGMKHETPLTPEAVQAFEEVRKHNPGIGEAWVFPAPKNDSEACSRHLMRDWWKRAEAIAGLKHEKRMGWHGLRRKFATDLKTVPLPDLCQLGGWRTSRTILECYQQPDFETQKQALLSRRAVGS